MPDHQGQNEGEGNRKISGMDALFRARPYPVDLSQRGWPVLEAGQGTASRCELGHDLPEVFLAMKRRKSKARCLFWSQRGIGIWRPVGRGKCRRGEGGYFARGSAGGRGLSFGRGLEQALGSSQVRRPRLFGLAT